MVIQLKELEQMDLFRGIHFDALPEELLRASVIRLESGETVLSPEKKNTTLFLLRSGALTVSLEESDSRPLRTIYPGGCVGELSLIEETRPSAWVHAIEPSELVALDRETLWDMLAADGRIAKNLLSLLSKRMIHNTELILLGKIRIRELEKAAMIDGLTNIYNRRWFDKAMVVHMNRYHRKMVPFALCLADIDRFKGYNDAHGHLGGDHALAAIAKTLTASVRPEDFVGRYGGEEFGIILAETRSQDADSIVERLLEAVRNAEIRDADGNLLPSVTISIGVAQPRAGSTVDTLIEAADSALYKAKDQGRDRSCTFEY
ncbi:MAG: GGDEF domain-containing protein [Desulfobacterales bacterium]|nr:GGDEF domain-containing protein [Desulfobacterales bacterium]